MKRIGELLLFSLLLAPPALAQIEKGSVGVIYYTNDKLIMAADSRSITRGREANDTKCKLAALGKNIVFINSGMLSYDASGTVLPGLDTIEEAHAAYQRSLTNPGPDLLDQVVAEWTASVWGRITPLYIHDPQLVLRGAENDILTIAMFGESRSDLLRLFLVRITVDPNRPPLQAIGIDRRQLTPSTAVRAIGKADVVSAYLDRSNPRTRQEDQQWASDSQQLGPENRDIMRIVRLVDLTIAYDGSGTVGGPVDALELGRGGEVRWVQRKPNCPAD